MFLALCMVLANTPNDTTGQSFYDIANTINGLDHICTAKEPNDVCFVLYLLANAQMKHIQICRPISYFTSILIRIKMFN